MTLHKTEMTDCVRYAFITGLHSTYLRQCLLENRILDLNTAVNEVRAPLTAQGNLESYSQLLWPNVGVIAAKSVDSFSCAITKTNSKCYFCGGSRQYCKMCPAREATCYRYGKKIYFRKKHLSDIPLWDRARIETCMTGAKITWPRRHSPNGQRPWLCSYLFHNHPIRIPGGHLEDEKKKGHFSYICQSAGASAFIFFNLL